MTRTTNKLCECGCEQPAPIAKTTNRKKGRIAGQPMRFVHHHNARLNHNPNWKGGRKITHGYVYIQSPDGAPVKNEAAYVREHILIAEKALGKRLPEGAIVHHMDGDRTNNAKTNLVICPSHSYHALLHLRLRALRACGHADYRCCTICHTWDAPVKLLPRGNTFEHRVCRQQKRKERTLREREAARVLVMQPQQIG